MTLLKTVVHLTSRLQMRGQAQACSEGHVKAAPSRHDYFINPLLISNEKP